MTMDSIMYLTGSRSGGGVLGASDPGRQPGMNALQRRAQQLRMWEENEQLLIEESRNGRQNHTTGHIKKPRIPRVKFSNETLFLAACANGDLEEAQRLLSNGTDINCVNIDGMTGMHQACIDDNLDIVMFLIDNGANVNACDNDGWTPLHAAANCGHFEIAEALLQSGADATIVNYDGELASDISDTESVKELINTYLLNGGLVPSNNLDELRKQELTIMTRDVNQWINSGKFIDKVDSRTGASFLHVAASKGYTSVIALLLNCSKLRSQVNIDIKDNENWTPLMAAVYWNQVSSVELLLQYGADPFVKTSTGQLLEDLTENRNIIELIHLQKKKLEEEAEARKAAVVAASSKTITNSTPTTPSISSGNASLNSTQSGTPTESETQRKAHAKRVRETRRSTQGISAEDISKAKDHIQQQQQQQQQQQTSNTSNNNNNNNNNNHSHPASSCSSVSVTPNTVTCSSSAQVTPTSVTPSSTAAAAASSTVVVSSCNTSQQLPVQVSCRSNMVTQINVVKDATVNGSTGAGATLTCQGDQPDSSSATETTNVSSITGLSNASTPSVAATAAATTTAAAVGNTQQHVTSTTKDYQKLYEEALESLENLRKSQTTKEVQWSKDRRLLQRKISEMEEELKNIDILKSDNQRLKDENGALIRVISKLSK